MLHYTSAFMSGKEEFCRKARKMLAEEDSGRWEYNKLIEYGYDWKDESSEPEQVQVNRMITDISAIRTQESVHAEILKRIIDHHCEGVGLT